jgi:chaperone BCS1
MIPYHYGIMLYGPSGTGKSTLIRAFISTYVEKLGLRNMENPLYLRSPSEMLMNPNDMSFSDTKYPRIIIIEDIDATILKKREKKEEENNNNNNEYRPYFQQSYQDDTSLSEILNKLDGLTNLENVIYVFTTNHIENLDPALVRPGRIDKLIHIDLPDRCAYNQFCQYHFGKSIPNNFEIKSHKLIAELQSEIVGGKDFDDILKILGKED